MLPTTTYIYGSKRTLIHVDIIDNYQISNVAWVGMGGTVKYLDFCQDSRTPNRILAQILRFTDRIAQFFSFTT